MGMYTYVILSLSTQSSSTPKIMSSLSSQNFLSKHHSSITVTRVLGEVAASRPGNGMYKINLECFMMSKVLILKMQRTRERDIIRIQRPA